MSMIEKKGKMMSINFYMIFSIFCRWGVWWWTWQDLYGNSCKTVSLKCAQINKTYKVLHFLYLNIEITKAVHLNTLRPRQNGFHFADDIFKGIFMHENVWISLKISLNFVPKVPINNISALVQIMAWRRPGNKPLFEPMMVNSMTHICVTLPQWVNER